MKSHQKESFQRWAETHMGVGDPDAKGHAANGWEAGQAYMTAGVVNRLIEVGQKLSDGLNTWAAHEYRPTCACNNCLAIGEFRGLVDAIKDNDE